MRGNPFLAKVGEPTQTVIMRDGLIEEQYEWGGRRCSAADEVLKRLLHQFRSIVPEFCVYHNFLSNKETSSQLLAQWRDREPFRSVWMGLLNKSRGLGPESFLVMPVQRLPRYKMLLEAIQKAMPRHHPGQQMVSEVHHLVCDNLDGFQRHLNAEKLKRIQKKVSTASPRRVMRNISIFTPTKARTFVLDGFLEKRLPVGKQKQYVLLLSDKFLYGPSEHSLRAVISLADANVYDAGEKTLIIEERGEGKERHKFDADSSQGKNKWVEIIRQTIAELSTSQEEAARAEAEAREKLEASKQMTANLQKAAKEGSLKSPRHALSQPRIARGKSFLLTINEDSDDSGAAGSDEQAAGQASSSSPDSNSPTTTSGSGPAAGQTDNRNQSIYVDAVTAPSALVDEPNIKHHALPTIVDEPTIKHQTLPSVLPRD